MTYNVTGFTTATSANTPNSFSSTGMDEENDTTVSTQEAAKTVFDNNANSVTARARKGIVTEVGTGPNSAATDENIKKYNPNTCCVIL